MKKILSILFALVLVLSMTMPVLASYNYALPVYVEWFGVFSPNAVGTYSQWDLGYVAVDEDWKNYNDADFTSSSVDAQNVTFNFPDISGSANISSVEIIARALKAYAADGIDFFYYNTGTGGYKDLGSLGSLTSTFAEYSIVFSVEPNTADTWNITSFNSAEFGFKKIGSTGIASVSQIYAKVNPSTINDATSISNLPLTVSLDANNLVSNGYITATSLDTNLEDANAFMNVSDRINFEISSISQYETKTLPFQLGYSPAQTGFPIIPGNNGYFTVVDNETYEITSNFTFSLDGYFVPSGSADIVTKGTSANITAASGNITMRIAGATGLVETLVPDAPGTYTNIPTLVGAATHWQAMTTIDDLTSYVQNTATANQTDTYNITDMTAPLNVVIDTVTIIRRVYCGSGASHTYSSPYIRLGSIDNVGAETDTLTADLWKTWTEVMTRPGGGAWTVTDLNNLEVGLNLRVNGAGVIGDATYVAAQVNYHLPDTVVSTPVSDGVHSINITTDISSVKLYVDNIVSANDTQSLLNAVVESSNSWVFMGGNSMLYATYIGQSVNNTNTMEFIPQTTLVSGTTLLNNINPFPGDSTNNTATLTYGTNPSLITTWVGPLVSLTSFAPPLGATSEEVPVTGYGPQSNTQNPTQNYPSGGLVSTIVLICQPGATALGMDVMDFAALVFGMIAVGWFIVFGLLSPNILLAILGYIVALLIFYPILGFVTVFSAIVLTLITFAVKRRI